MGSGEGEEGLLQPCTCGDLFRFGKLIKLFIIPLIFFSSSVGDLCLSTPIPSFIFTRMRMLQRVLFSLFALAHFCSAAVYAPLPSKDYNEEVLVLTLQGLANRNGADLLLDTSSLFWQYSGADAYWKSYFEVRIRHDSE